ncbi:MAG: hypothetical protein HYZ54_03720, partial [Ignavibacteriae bacterium]|nr:hypothetical protein [Ignavibacteriota bacterium]
MSLIPAPLNGTVLSHPYSCLAPFPFTPQPLSSPSKPSSYAIIDSTVPHNRLFETDQGEVVLIPKTPAEVAGEKLLRPLIDTVHHLASKAFPSTLVSSVLNLGKSCLSLASSIPFPQLNLLPMASAQPSDPHTLVHKEKEEEPQDLLVEVTTPTFPTWQDLDVFPSSSKKPSSQALFPSGPSQVVSFQHPTLFTAIFTSPEKIDWSSPEFDKAS